jgi:hypothetical protein
LATGSQAAETGRTYFLVVAGLGGEDLYEKRFEEDTNGLAEVLKKTAEDPSLVQVLKGAAATRQAIEQALTKLEKQMKPEDSLALMMIGHGSYDGYEYKFNIPGPDIDGERLKLLLDRLPGQRQLIVNTTSASGAALDLWKNDKRVVVAATKNGRERTATIFAKYWVAALSDAEADTDKNEVISALEAYQYAERKVKDFYELETRLATEHPRLEGSLASGFTLARLGSALEAASDPATRELMRQREALERDVEALKLRKDSLAEDEYLDQLQKLVLELAELQQKIDAAAK